MVKRPKISVIIPIYNVEDYLNRCLESVVNQTLFDIEIIGVNDGTKDDSVAIIRKYMALDKRIQLVEKGMAVYLRPEMPDLKWRQAN